MSSCEGKHAREGDEDEEAESRPPPPKRFFHGLSPLSPRAEELISILEEDADCGERNAEEFVPAEEVVCGVMKSLEEEISGSSRGEEIRSSDFSNMDEMSYLLRASDDELGIPPSPSVYEDAYSAVAESQVLGESEHACNLEGLWQLEDPACC
uniref:Late embryogenesis abundant protein n=1 Tax=Picea glauca TaxID=3330 RepID=Q40859_PICGL|nr:late embryogenesis abundant protein [Picea glauca]